MNLILTGYRGSGKTKIGRALAEALNRTWCDLDPLIEEKAKMTIPEIVEKDGWDKFRELEHEACKEVATKKNCIISTGGGTMIYDRNADILKENAVTIYLTAPPHVLASRISKSKKRPALTSKGDFLTEIEEVLIERDPLYNRVADFTFDVSEDRPFDKKAADIIEILTLEYPQFFEK